MNVTLTEGPQVGLVAESDLKHIGSTRGFRKRRRSIGIADDSTQIGIRLESDTAAENYNFFEKELLATPEGTAIIVGHLLDLFKQSITN